MYVKESLSVCFSRIYGVLSVRVPRRPVSPDAKFPSVSVIYALDVLCEVKWYVLNI